MTLVGCRAPVGRRSVGSVTSTVSSTSTRASRSASSCGAALGQRSADVGLRQRRPACPADGRAAGGQRTDLPVGQRDRRPVAGVREPCGLQLVEVRGGGDRVERGADGGVELFWLEGGHLDRVERFGGHAGVDPSSGRGARVVGFDGRDAGSNQDRCDQPRAGMAAASRAANIADRDVTDSASMHSA